MFVFVCYRRGVTHRRSRVSCYGVLEELEEDLCDLGLHDGPHLLGAEGCALVERAYRIPDEGEVVDDLGAPVEHRLECRACGPDVL